MGNCHKRISPFEFEAAEIAEAVRNQRLLSMEIEFSRACNFNCRYCYVMGQPDPRPEMRADESRGVIVQAQALGARKIIVLGGEPMIYPAIYDMIRFIRSRGLDLELFTNGTNVTPDTARFLFENRVKVALKMNSRDGRVQDVLAGREGAHATIAAAFANLTQAGYPSEESFLAVSTVICRDNLAELPGLWQWLRDRNIEPYFEMITPQGNARQNEWLDVDPRQAYEVFKAIAEMDRTRYDREWEPQPPLVGNRCLRHRFSCLVNAFGDVLPCVGVSLPIGNVREKPLGDIIRDSEVLQDLRNYTETIKGPCGECEKAAQCYGCRGAAYQLTGDYLASDPLCWRHPDKPGHIPHLPYAADGLIPHRPPMRVVDRLLSVGERCATAECTVSANSPFVGADGALDEAAYMEIVAQAAAALNGFRAKRGAGAPQGFLLGAKNLEILDQARAGDQLTVSIRKDSQYGDFGIVTGTISRNGTVVAKGEIKVWHKTAGAGVAGAEPVAAAG